MNNDIKYLHYRGLDAKGNVDSRGGATVAFIQGEEGTSFGVAFCHDNDRFDKAMGRTISSGRLVKHGRTYKVTDRYEFIKQMDDIMAQQYLFRLSRCRVHSQVVKQITEALSNEE